MKGLARGDVDLPLDCIGIGVGPSNLSLSCLLHPHRVRHVLLEKRATCAWHEGLLLEGATLQVSFLKDLVTLVDPTSRFSFICYLKRHGRLYQFINASFPATLRAEWNLYLQWVCAELATARFEDAVREVRFDDDFVVRTDQTEYRARNIVLGAGLRPKIPAVAAPSLGDTVFHASRYLSIAPRAAGQRVAVVGGGQSGAEVLLNFLEAPEAEQPVSCNWISRRPGFLPMDDSPFTNELYMPQYSEYFFSLPQAVRGALLEQQKLTSDGISQETLTRIYQAMYVRRNLHRGNRAGALLAPGRELVALDRAATGWRLTLRHGDTGAREVLEADVVVLATGYEFALPEFLAPLAGRLEMEGREPRVGRDYAVAWNGPRTHRIFVQNASRQQRGVADPNLSLLAWRSARIANAIAGAELYDLREAEPFIEWSAGCPAPAELCA